MDLGKLLKLTDEQMAILHQIGELMREFNRAGGVILYDLEDYSPCAINVKECENYDWGYRYDIERDHEGEGYIDVTEHIQPVPFDMPDFGYDSSFFVKLKHSKQNLF